MILARHCRGWRIGRPALLLAGLVLAGSQLAAAQANLEFAPAPIFGADVRSLVFDPTNPDRAFAGTSGGHVYVSEDGGESWREAFGRSAPFPGWVVGTLAFDPNRPGRLWAGLWGVWGGGRVAWSDDLGASWALHDSGLPAGDQVYALAFVPGAAGRLFAATRSGVWRTDDDGAHWSRTSESEPRLIQVSSLWVDPQQPERILAGTWRRAFRSLDGGATWREIPNGMLLDSEVFAIQAVPGEPGRLWASTCGWIYRGEDYGDRWTRVRHGFAERRTPSLLVLSADRVLAGTVAGLHLSTDGGETFRRTSDGALPILAMAAHPARPRRVLIGTEGAGIWVSEDGGETLSPRLAGTANVRVPALAAAADTVFAAVAHAGPLSGIYRSPDGGVSFAERASDLPTVLDLATVGDTVYAATEGGLFERSGNGWRRIDELETARIEQLLIAGDRLLARGRDRVWERDARRRFVPVDLGLGGSPDSLAFVWDDLWARAEGRLWRLRAGVAPEPISLPAADARPVPAGNELLVVASAEGVWLRRDVTAAWERLPDEPGRALPTGNAHYPLLVAGARTLALLSVDGSRSQEMMPSFPTASVRAALLEERRLWVGTSGHGLWSVDLPGPVSVADRVAAGSAAGGTAAPSVVVE